MTFQPLFRKKTSIFPDDGPYQNDTKTQIPLAEQTFLMGAIRAVKNSPHIIQKRVLSDLSNMFGCESRALEFLFRDIDDSGIENQIYDFPDTAKRRRIRELMHSQAAE